mmetsp:Transcript_2384/g.5147  ORF Transcript_2384/g.5147 Transcript_2384/m.5147 type:complete len:393 (-) Transcript_2384:57-1235(-)
MELLVGLAVAHEGVLLLLGLEAAVAELGGGVDELEVDRLVALGAGHDGLAQGERALLDADAAALDHDPVVTHDAVVREAANGVDVLLGQIGRGGSGGGIALLANAVDGLVDLRAVVVAALTSAGDLETDASRVPRTDASNLAQTTVSLARQAGNAPASDDASVAVALGGTEDVDALALVEHGLHVDGLLQKAAREVDLGSGIGTAVDLDLEHVSLLLAKVQVLDVGVSDDADAGAVRLHAGKLALELGGVLSPLLGVLGERLLLAGVPVRVEAAAALLVQVLGPHGGQGAQTLGGLDVANDAHDGDRRGLDDGDGLEGLLLVQLGAGAHDIAHDVGHAGLVAHERGQVRGDGGIVLGEVADLATVLLGALAGQEAKRAVAGSFELAVRHGIW